MVKNETILQYDQLHLTIQSQFLFFSKECYTGYKRNLIKKKEEKQVLVNFTTLEQSSTKMYFLVIASRNLQIAILFLTHFLNKLYVKYENINLLINHLSNINHQLFIKNQFRFEARLSCRIIQKIKNKNRQRFAKFLNSSFPFCPFQIREIVHN